jgi:hypothetical protein
MGMTDSGFRVLLGSSRDRPSKSAALYGLTPDYGGKGHGTAALLGPRHSDARDAAS